ncbi:MAG: TetR family transcriptional regulator [Alphaproteobacteria bacterium]|nr:TetR family transcriptional regulator [Alphaproteobacteria bacterium]
MAHASLEPVSQRERAKAERRARIVAAAAGLLREFGFDGVSMAQIAERAEVSEKTLYNLFATKAAIFRQVFDEDLAAYERALARRGAGAGLDRLFSAIEAAAAFYRRDPKLYRAMARISGGGDEGLNTAISEPRRAFWRGLIAACVETQSLRKDTNIALVSSAVSQLFGGAFYEWAAGAISAERLAQEATFGAASLLLPHASEKAARALQRRMRAAQDALAAGAGKMRRSADGSVHPQRP